MASAPLALSAARAVLGVRETRETKENLDSINIRVRRLFVRLKRIETKIDEQNEHLKGLLDFFEEEKRRREIMK